MSAPHWQSANELAALIRTGQLKSVELVEVLLARIAKLDPSVNAFIRCDAEEARRAALAADAEIADGRYRGPLHGIPVGIKDVIDVQGLPTTCHSKVRLDHVAAEDATAVARLRQAGAIILGKLSTHEFALGGPSFDLPFPPARNPWNADHHPGGSSSGSGAGLAAGFFPLALGTDTGGSVRNPASMCGVVGLKPTYGLVSRRGVFPLAYTLDHVGPMARSVADIALLLDIIAGHDPADVSSVTGTGTKGANAKGSYGHMLDKGVANLRIGYVRHFHETDMPADPAVAQALDRVAEAMAGEGAKIVEARLPDLNAFSSVNRIILQAEAWAIHAPWLRERPQDYGASGRRRLLAGAFLTAEDYVMAQRRRATMIAAVEAVMGEVDLLLTASAMDPACRIDDEATLQRTYPRQARTPFNVTGHPAIAMMAGLSADGLPLSVQFVGRHFDEATVLRAAAAWERIGGWQDRHPPAFA
ncbi:MAG TPA: amidase [Stellaceae bacterium]|nr:amidase [Stellaceae bacterium]